MRYPDAPGYQPHSKTSEAAAGSAKTSSKRQAEEIFHWMASRGLEGATIDEGVIFLSGRYGRDMQASPRFRQLELAGRIVKTDQERKTRTGNRASVYRVAHIASGDPAPPIKAPSMRGVTAAGHNKMIDEMGLPDSWKVKGGKEPSAYDRAVDQLSRTGHGHVVSRRDGKKERCSGVMNCKKCKQEQAYLQGLKD